MLIFLLSHQRSGSHLLKHTLEAGIKANGHANTANLVVPPELFTPTGEKYPVWKDWSLESFVNARTKNRAGIGPAELAEIVQEFVPHLKEVADGKTALCDIKFNQLYVGIGWYHAPAVMPPILSQLCQYGKIIRLRRRNVLRSVVSGLVAAQTGVWHRKPTDKEAMPAPPKLQNKAPELIRLVEVVQKSIDLVEEWLAPFGNAVLRIDYEDLNDPNTGTCNPETFNSIARFMGLPESQNWTADFSKTGTYQLADVFEDREGVISAITSSPYAWMLDDNGETEARTENGNTHSSNRFRFNTLLKKLFVPGTNL